MPLALLTIVVNTFYLGQFGDRRTMLGELNWIFTAITDTIAWNTLPRTLFQKLFRQDLLVASLFRNFLLAERVMRSYDCTPVSQPPLPSTHQVKHNHLNIHILYGRCGFFIFPGMIKIWKACVLNIFLNITACNVASMGLCC